MLVLDVMPTGPPRTDRNVCVREGAFVPRLKIVDASQDGPAGRAGGGAGGTGALLRAPRNQRACSLVGAKFTRPAFGNDA